MQETRGFLYETTNYAHLKGDTGPLVYPAGFLYIYSLLLYVTDGDIPTAQWIFAALYCVTLWVVLRVLKNAGVPPCVVVLCCLSKRLHSIYVLRLFNDTFVTLALWVSLWLFQREHFLLASFRYSLGISVKMNLLLVLPAVGVLLGSRSLKTLLKGGFVIVMTQIWLGLPFLLTYPSEYLSRAYELGRVFLYKWTVNWRFVPEQLFLNSNFHVALLCGYVILTVVFGHFIWTSRNGGLLKFLNGLLSSSLYDGNLKNTEFSKRDVVLIIGTNQLIGILTQRSLHYQFYAWYLWTLPFLVYVVSERIFASRWLRLFLTCLMVGVIEVCWNVYPSTTKSSVTLLACHIVLVSGLFLVPLQASDRRDEKSKKRS